MKYIKLTANSVFYLSLNVIEWYIGNIYVTIYYTTEFFENTFDKKVPLSGNSDM